MFNFTIIKNISKSLAGLEGVVFDPCLGVVSRIVGWGLYKSLDRLVRTRVHQFQIFNANRENKYRSNFLSEPVCSCCNELPSSIVGAGNLNEFNSKLNAHFAIFALLTTGRHVIFLRKCMLDLFI